MLVILVKIRFSASPRKMTVSYRRARAVLKLFAERVPQLCDESMNNQIMVINGNY